MQNFDFVKPSSVAEAVAALAQSGAQALSGGQTLTPTMKQRLATPDVLVSLTGIAELKGVKQNGGTLWVGAATPHAQVAKDAASVLRGWLALRVALATLRCTTAARLVALSPTTIRRLAILRQCWGQGRP